MLSGIVQKLKKVYYNISTLQTLTWSYSTKSIWEVFKYAKN